MKKLVIKNCGDCPHLFKHKQNPACSKMNKWLPFKEGNKKKGTELTPTYIIPIWCPLESEKPKKSSLFVNLYPYGKEPYWTIHTSKQIAERDSSDRALHTGIEILDSSDLQK